MIPFTQYVRPNGRRREEMFDAEPEIEALAVVQMAKIRRAR